MIQSFNPPNMSDFQKRALIVGIVFLVVLIAGAFVDPRAVFPGVFDRLDVLDRNRRRLACAPDVATPDRRRLGLRDPSRRSKLQRERCRSWRCCLFPLLIGAHSIYHEWMDHEEVAKHPVVQFKTPYLNLPFFAVRAVIYFAIWIALAFFLNKWSLAQDRTADNRYTKNMRVLSGPGMVALIFSVTFRVDRLVHVDRAGMVFDDLRFHFRRGVDFERARVCDRGDGATCRAKSRCAESSRRCIFTISASCCWRS